MIYKYYDTSALLHKSIKDIVAETGTHEHNVISIISLFEAEKILESLNYDENSYIYKNALDLREFATNKYYKVTTEILMPNDELFEIFECKEIYEKDLLLAKRYDKYKHPDETIFITANCAVYHLANTYFGEDSIEFIK